MKWFHVLGSEGESRVGSHVYSHSIDILVVPWVPNGEVCPAYDFMRAVGHMQGLQEPVSRFFVFYILFGAAQENGETRRRARQRDGRCNLGPRHASRLGTS